MNSTTTALLRSAWLALMSLSPADDVPGGFQERREGYRVGVAATALLASYLLARRASRVPPVEAPRE